MSRVFVGTGYMIAAFARPARPYTMVMWIKPTALGANRDAFHNIDQALTDFEGIRLNNTNNFVGISRSIVGTNSATSTVVVAQDVWHLVVARYNAIDSRECLVNGTANSGSNGVTNGPLSDEISIGRAVVDGTRLQGKTGHGSVYSRSLSDAEVVDLAAGKNPQDIADLVYYLDMLTSGLTDSVGGVTMSIVGTATFDGADNPPVNAAAAGAGGSSFQGTDTFAPAVQGPATFATSIQS